MEAVEQGHGRDALGPAQGGQGLRRHGAVQDRVLQPGAGAVVESPRVVPDPPEKAVGAGGGQCFPQGRAVGGQGVQPHQMAVHSRRDRRRLLLRLVDDQAHARPRLGILRTVRRLGDVRRGRFVIAFSGRHPLQEFRQVYAQLAAVGVGDVPLYKKERAGGHQDYDKHRNKKLDRGGTAAAIILISPQHSIVLFSIALAMVFP